MSPHHPTGERARWGSCLYTTLQVRGRGGGHVSIAHYRLEGEVGVMSPHCTTGERARWGSCLYSTLQVRGRFGVMSLHHTTGERAM